MGNETKRFVPLLIGADMNCYSVARAIHEQYGVESYALGRFAAGDTKYSKIVHCTYDTDLEDTAVLRAHIERFAAEHADETVVVWGCTDGYAAMLMQLNEEGLPSNCVAPYIGVELRDKLEAKASFYEMCDAYNIPYPKTFVVSPSQFEGMDASSLSPAALGFEYPIIVKPSVSEEYWRHSFDGMKKVYTAADEAEALHILGLIFGAGYPEKVILQDTIPGEDSNMRILTGYSDRDGKVKMMCFGRVGLEEHTATALGNPCAIITESNPSLQEPIKTWLEEIGFTGFSNFDIKFDPRDNTYKVFEINLRQGRSNFYVTGAGQNIARLVVEDRVYQRDLGECRINESENLYRSVPRRVVREYVSDPEFVKRANALIKQGKESVSHYYDFDLRGNLMRWLYVKAHMFRYFDKFKNPGNYK